MATSKIIQPLPIVELGADGQGANSKCLYIKHGKYVYVYAWVHKTASSWTIFSSLPKPLTADIRLCNAEKLMGTDTELGSLNVFISSGGSLQIHTTNTSDNVYIATGWYITTD